MSRRTRALDSRTRATVQWGGWALLLLLTLPTAGQPRPAAARGTAVVPDDFLRSWDPVTLFFDRDRGPADGGPEDQPERWVQLSPVHPGAFRWLDSRTLQFRPSEPWPPLERFTVRVDGRTVRLATLMASPTGSVPGDGEEQLRPIEEIALSFAVPLDPQKLAQAVTLELAPLPGIGADGQRWLNDEDFSIKVIERARRDELATYVLQLEQPIPLGIRATVHLRLSLDDDERSFSRLSFSTAEPFRIVDAGCREERYPVTATGSHYSVEQTLRCAPLHPAVVVTFSAEPAPIGPVEARNLVRLTPPVAALEVELQGRQLILTGAFLRDTSYRIELVSTPLRDRQGRPLELPETSSLHVSYPAMPSFARWESGSGTAERRGSQAVPVLGRGDERLDLRLHKVDPFDRSFWPFPAAAVLVDEEQRPPGPGEAPAPFTAARGTQIAAQLAAQIAALGSPGVSTLVELPLRRGAGAARFGLDLEGSLQSFSGRQAPGTYLVGLRRLGEPQRSWMRLQVSDLALTTLEEPERVVFAVTSLADASAVSGARVRIEGTLYESGRDPAWAILFDGRTDDQGLLTWHVPGSQPRRRVEVRRIVVEQHQDTLVLDATQPPDVFADGVWGESWGSWLQWTHESLEGRGPETEWVAHLFTERPVYRPDEPVLLKGWLRTRSQGKLEKVTQRGFLVIDGPGDLEWRYPIEPSESGGIDHRFDEEKLPTGVYRATFELADSPHLSLGSVSFRKEAYRIPRFEVRLSAAQRVPLDRPFDVQLTASYYAGGRVAGQPLEWRVTQFPYSWAPKTRQGFVYSSDGRFSRLGRFESTPAVERQTVTDEQGAAVLSIDPGIEPTAQPRTYVVEATVVGADDQTVTATQRVVALPPFLLGLAVPRYLERAERVAPQVLVLGPDDEPLAGQQVTVRLLQRQWHSHLQASDFADGVARYVTEVVDEPIAEQSLTSGEAPIELSFELPEAGVYLVELEGRDALGRTQVVAVDFFAGGEAAVAWSKPTTELFEVGSDQPRYRPGDVAHLVLESPFQNASALVVVEAPEGNQTQWHEVRGGKAVVDVSIHSTFAPRLPVHVLLMRGRVKGTRPTPGSTIDLGRPATMGATIWLEVEPVANRLEVSLEAPSKSLPGKEIEIVVRLATPDGRPAAGEVALWLVDQAVLALGREQRLDPLPDYLTPVRSRLEARDSRGDVFGEIPFALDPGGGEGEESRDLLDRQTVRKNFQPVPFWEPSLQVGPEGEARVRVQLPDNLTNFALRAKAASGAERFGHAVGHLEVRLPVLVQPALPRFVRPGDRFVAAAIGRVVEGDGGPGRAVARFDGVELLGPAELEVSLLADRPRHLEFPVRVPTPEAGATAALPAEAVFRVGLERSTDGAGDAFEVRLPIRPDREAIVERVIVELVPGMVVALPDALQEPRTGTLRRAVLLSDQPALLRMAAGLSFFAEYPYGCTEQRVSKARAQLALRRFRDLLHQAGDDQAIDRAVEDTLAWIPAVLQPNGLCAYWPGSPGYVSLTAWVMELLVEAKAAGYAVDEELAATLRRALEKALRSDYSGFIDGESWAERTFALRALSGAGHFESSYAAELSRRAQFLDLEGVAAVLLAFERADQGSSAAIAPLIDELWKGLIVRLFQGEEIYGGLQGRREARNGLILPSETRTLADMTRALSRLVPGDPRLQLLVEALVHLGSGDGWGTTNANAAALLALSEVLQPQGGDGVERTVRIRLPGRQAAQATLGPDSPTLYYEAARRGEADVTLDSAAPAGVVMRAELSYLPLPDGSTVEPRRDGFVVERDWRLQTADPPRRVPLEQGGGTLTLSVGDVVEEHLRVVNPTERAFVAIVLPLAAGLEPLNPALATAPPEAEPDGRLTLAPTYVAALDDQIAFYYNLLPKGAFDFYYRTRATVAGSFIQPPAKAEMMYDASVVGTSAGARVDVEARE